MINYTLSTIIDGKVISQQLPLPERLPRPGDVYVTRVSMKTAGGSEYNPGDEFTIVRRTSEAPHNWFCSLGNLVIRTKYGQSVWSCFDDCVRLGTIVLKS